MRVGAELRRGGRRRAGRAEDRTGHVPLPRGGGLAVLIEARRHVHRVWSRRWSCCRCWFASSTCVVPLLRRC